MIAVRVLHAPAFAVVLLEAGGLAIAAALASPCASSPAMGCTGHGRHRLAALDLPARPRLHQPGIPGLLTVITVEGLLIIMFLGRGTTIAGQVFGPDGELASFARIEFVNADSAQNGGVADFSPGSGPTYTTHVKAQRVKIHFYTSDLAGASYDGWLGGSGFADADVSTIPDAAEFVLDVSLPAQSI